MANLLRERNRMRSDINALIACRGCSILELGEAAARIRGASLKTAPHRPHLESARLVSQARSANATTTNVLDVGTAAGQSFAEFSGPSAAVLRYTVASTASTR